MKKYLCAFIFTVILIAVLNPILAEDKNFANNFFQFKYDPSVWMMQADESDPNIVSLKYNFTAQKLILDPATGFLFQANESEDPNDIATIKKGIKGILKESSWPSPEILSVKDVQCNGAQGIETIFVSDFQDKKLKILQYIYRKDKNIYMITAAAILEEFDKARPVFDALIKTYVIK